MLSEIINKINCLVKIVNDSYNSKKALHSHDISITFYTDNQSFHCLIFLNDKSNYTVNIKKIEHDLFDGVISAIQQIHLLNSHLNFYVNDGEMTIFHLNNKTLLMPLMNDVIKSFQDILQQPIEEDQRIAMQYSFEISGRLDLLIVFHTFLPIGAFDLMIYNNRLINQNAMNAIQVEEKLLSLLKKCYGFEINGTRLDCTKRFFPKNFSLIIMVNAIGDNIDNSVIFNQLYDCFANNVDDYLMKMKNYLTNMTLNMNFRTIKQSLIDVYHLTNNVTLYQKMKDLFENDKETFDQKLFNSFIQGKYLKKEDETQVDYYNDGSSQLDY